MKLKYKNINERDFDKIALYFNAHYKTINRNANGIISIDYKNEFEQNIFTIKPELYNSEKYIYFYGEFDESISNELSIETMKNIYILGNNIFREEYKKVINNSFEYKVSKMYQKFSHIYSIDEINTILENLEYLNRKEKIEKIQKKIDKQNIKVNILDVYIEKGLEKYMYKINDEVIYSDKILEKETENNLFVNVTNKGIFYYISNLKKNKKYYYIKQNSKSNNVWCEIKNKEKIEELNYSTNWEKKDDQEMLDSLLNYINKPKSNKSKLSI